MALTKGVDVIDGVVRQIQQFQEGKIQPLKTGVEYVDYHLLGGFYPSTILSVVALSQHGKTYELEKILNNLERSYGKDTIFVKNLWELSLFKVVVREMAKITKQPVKNVLTQTPEKDVAKLYKEICDRYRKDNIFLAPLPVTPEQFYEDTLDIIKRFPDKKIIVTCDNLENVLLANESQKITMDRVVQKINLLNKMHPFICFIILNQMNREYADRVADNPKHHFVQEGDIYGSSALYKISDVVYSKVLPYRLGLDKFMVFGSDRYAYISDEFKNIGANTSTFKGIGNAFYQFIKSRDIPEEFDRNDIFVESIFSPPVKEENKVQESVDFNY